MSQRHPGAAFDVAITLDDLEASIAAFCANATPAIDNNAKWNAEVDAAFDDVAIEGAASLAALKTLVARQARLQRRLFRRMFDVRKMVGP